MKEINTEFKLIVAIGIRGCALIEFKEGPIDLSPVNNNCNCIMHDIDDYGFRDWLDYLPIKLPNDFGFYKITGKSICTTEGATFHDVEIYKLKTFSISE